MKRSLLISLLMLFFGSNTQAAVIYNEAVQGDLTSNWQGIPATSLNLQAGENTIVGSSRYIDDPGNPGSRLYDFDDFYFTLSEGHVVNSISFLVTRFTSTGNPTIQLTTDFAIYKAPDRWMSPFAQARFNILSTSEQVMSGPGLPFAEAATYHLRNFAVGSNFSGGGHWDYQFTFNVGNTVPEPTSLLALILGLVVLMRVRLGTNT